ncbi:MAG TPA: hypothetical protein VG651_16545 [Stellaceae bacterium]|nr:hypothetical protein [Stellaceae bacterium]
MSLGSHNLRDGEDTALGPGAALLIGTLRRIAAGRECAALSRRDFAMAFPGDADEVFVTFRAFLQSLAHAGRRKLRVAPPGSGRATPDETSIIALIAAAQTGDAARLDAHLCWLARGEAQLLVAVMARALATALGVHGQWLRSDEAPPPARASGGKPCLSRC